MESYQVSDVYQEKHGLWAFVEKNKNAFTFIEKTRVKYFRLKFILKAYIFAVCSDM